MRTRRCTAAATAGLILGFLPTVPAHAAEAVTGKDSTGAAITRVTIQNRYPHRIDVVVGIRHGSCNEWLLTGWYNIESGDSKQVATVDTGAFLYYAYAPTDNHKWSGSVLHVNVPSNRFSTCDEYLQGSSAATRPIGMRLRTFTAGVSNYTLPLIP